MSLLDYEDFALAFTGIAKAQAQVLQLPAGPTIAITVAGQDGARAVRRQSRCGTTCCWRCKTSGDPHVNVALLSYQASTFRLGLKVKRDPAYERETAARRGGSGVARALLVRRRARSAQPVLQSDVIAVAHSVPGVVAVDLDFLYGGTAPAAQTVRSRQTRLLASRMRVSGGVALPAELLTLHPGSARPAGGDGMSSLTAERLYSLLPAVYRVRDEQQGKPLRALVSLIAQEFEALEENVEQLYDDQFIETCAEWVAPYIGDLIGYRPLHGVAAAVASPRAEVANTIAYRRRKGTAAMLEQLARDVTDWPARAVEFFEQLATTQYMNHVRLHAPATADLRSTRAHVAGGRPVQRGGAHRRDAPARERRGPLQHSEHRHLPVAAAGVAAERRAADSRPRRCERPQVPLQSARRRPAAVPPAA